MTKSYALLVQDLYAGILDDVRIAFPDLHLDTERDYSRLLSSLELRGCSFFTIELPEVGKHFDKCLSHGLLTRSSLAQQRPFRTGAVVPRLFKGLLLKVFKASGELLETPDLHAIRLLRQLYYAAKKLRMECSNERTWKQARSFVQVDSSLRRASLSWDADDLFDCEESDLHFGEDYRGHRDPEPDLFDLEKGEDGPDRSTLDTLQSVADMVSAEMGWFNPQSYRLKHGPGAVSGLAKGHSKYEFPHWPDKLERVFPMADFAFANHGCWADSLTSGELVGRFSKHEPPSVLIAVPKTAKGPRLIAKEPVAYQWCQQSILRYFVARVDAGCLREFISFDDQSKNQLAALQASRNQQLMTVDLSSASDRVSCWSVERLFRRNKSLLEALHATRTRWCENTIDPALPRYLKLRKFASMGSACTFPVETIFFTVVAIAATLSEYGWIPSYRNIRLLAGKVRVFGDDIIIDKDARDRFLGLLRYLELEVNQSKTFDTGKFRESCGCDAYDGADVTPTYCMTYPSRDRPDSVTSVVATHNNFVRNGYAGVARRLRSTLLSLGLNLPEVTIESGSFGLATLARPDNSRLRKRWCPDLHKWLYRFHAPTGRSVKVPDRGHSALLQYFTEEPAPAVKWENGYVSRARSYLTPGWREIRA